MYGCENNLDHETVTVAIICIQGNSFLGELKLFEESPENSSLVQLELNIDGKVLRFSDNSFFEALLQIRSILEKDGLQIKCNGAARNVYPSTMQLSMGSGRLACLMHMGSPAKRDDIVDIFECDDTFDFVSIKEQASFYLDWINSINNRS